MGSTSVMARNLFHAIPCELHSDCQCYGGNRWLLKRFRAHILRTDRDVKYSGLVDRIKSAGLVYCQNEQWRSNVYEISF